MRGETCATACLVLWMGLMCLGAAAPKNLVENGDFEMPLAGPESRGKVPQGWSHAFAGRAERLEIVPETRPGSPGKQCLKVDTDEKVNSSGLFTKLIPLDPQKVLRVSGWMKGGGMLDIPQGAYFGVGWYDANRKPIPVKKETSLNYTYLGAGYKKTEWLKCERDFYPCFDGPKESYGPNDIPPNAAFFDIRIFALEYPKPAYFDDIFATQDVADSGWIVGWEGGDEAAAAAREMAKQMSKVLEVEVSAGPWRAYQAKNIFVVADARHAPPEVAKRLEGKRLDAFLIQYPAKLHDREVCLLVANDPKGCDFPVHHFLRKYLGMEWVGPEPLGLVFEPRPEWKMPARIEEVREPHYEHRYWNEPGMNIRRWLAGSFRLQFHHNLGNVFDPAKYANQPELYPLYEGTRHVPDPKRRMSGWQPCTGNPKSVDIAVQYGLEYLAKNPGHKSFSLSVNDGGAGICMCDLCRAQDSKNAFDSGQPFLSDRFFRFYNAVIERVIRERPDAYLAVLGYGRCKSPPVEVKVHPHVLVFSVCDNTNPQPDFFQRQKDWKATGATPCIYQWLWDCGFLTVRHYPHALRDVIALTHSLGGFGYYCEALTIWAAGGPKFYVLAHLLWDTQSDVDALLNRYMQLAFGQSAAPSMRAYFDRWEEIWERGGKEIRHNTGRDWRSASQLADITRADLAAMDAALQQAMASRATPEQRRRVEYVERYYRWLRINADQYLITREIADEAWLAIRNPEEIFREAERGMKLTDEFDSIWNDTISKDRTGWLLSARYHQDVEGFWKNMVQPIRTEVIRAYEPALDIAFNSVTQRLLRETPQPRVIAFWQDSAARHPMLAKWMNTQIYLLEHGPGKNLVSNPGFEEGTPGNPPNIPGWKLQGSWQDIPADFAWEAKGGRNGSAALAIGRGYTASANTSFPAKQDHRYRVSLWYKTSGSRTRVSGGGPNFSLPLKPTSGEWRYASTTFTASGDGTIALTLSALGQDKGEWTWFDDVEIVEICAKK